MRWDIWIWNKCCGNRREGDEELRTEVCAQTGNKACCCCEGDLLFDVEVEAVELVDCDYGVEGDIVCFKLLYGLVVNVERCQETHALIVSSQSFECALRCAAQHAQNLHATALQPAYFAP